MDRSTTPRSPLSSCAPEPVCAAGFGGTGCQECAVGFWSTGGDSTTAFPTCTACPTGKSTPSTQAMSSSNCSGARLHTRMHVCWKHGHAAGCHGLRGATGRGVCLDQILLHTI